MRKKQILNMMTSSSQQVGPSADMTRSTEEDSLVDGPLISADALQSAMRREFQSVPTTCPAGLLSLIHVTYTHIYSFIPIFPSFCWTQPLSVLFFLSGGVCGAVDVCGRSVRVEVWPAGGVPACSRQRAGRQRHRVGEGVSVGADAAAHRLDASPPQPRPQPWLPELLQADAEAQAAAAQHTFNRWDNRPKVFLYCYTNTFHQGQNLFQFNVTEQHKVTHDCEAE